MAVKPIPEGYGTITPYLVVHGAHDLLDFVKRAFDAEVVERMANPDGTIMHAAVRIGDSMVMMGEASGGFQAMPAMIHLYVPDADATYARALAAGATPVREVGDQFYGDRTGGVKDASGNQWWIATHKEDVSAEELHRRFEAMQRTEPPPASAPSK